MKIGIIILFFAVMLFACGSNNQNNAQQGQKDTLTIKTTTKFQLSDFTDTIIADGFDYPVGNADGKGNYHSITDGKVYNSWYSATNFLDNYSLGIHSGIDLNGSGGGDTDLGQPVYSIAKGTVVEALDFGPPWGNVVIIKHIYLENGTIKHCYSVYAHLRNITIKKGAYISKRKKIGEIGKGGGSYPAHLHLEIRKENMKEYVADYWPSSNDKSDEWIKEHYENPENFINNHRKTTCPSIENKIIIVIKSAYRMHYFEKGNLKCNFEIALSQSPIGHKEKQGDLKLPEGEYYICGKEKGPFYGNFSEYLGNRLIRISYPNKYDAMEGLKKGLISKKEKENIVKANSNNTIPPKNTKLGGGIAIHGWYGDWIADGNQNLTWGCISMHNKDIEKFYEIITKGTKIIISR